MTETERNVVTLMILVLVIKCEICIVRSYEFIQCEMSILINTCFWKLITLTSNCFEHMCLSMSDIVDAFSVIIDNKLSESKTLSI